MEDERLGSAKDKIELECNKKSYRYDNDSSNDKPRYVPCSGNLAESEKRFCNGYAGSEVERVEGSYAPRGGKVCMMMPALVGDHINGRGVCGDARKVCTYFDVERREFRCFQLQSLVKIF